MSPELTAGPDSAENKRYARILDRLALPRFTRLRKPVPLVVALEGPNGAGKTILCRRLGRSLGAYTCLGTPRPWFSKPLKARMIRDADWFASAMFFLSGCFERMREIRSMSAPLVIMDRSLWSTLAVHAAANPERLAVVTAMIRPVASSISVPDLTLVLEASFETCLSRIARKDRASQALDQLTANARFHAREQVFYRWLARQTPTVQFLNVDRVDARQVAAQAKSLIAR